MKNQKLLYRANSIFFIILIFSVLVQYNDPDPLGWMLIYGAGALCCFLVIINKCHWFISGIVLLVTVFCAGMFFPEVYQNKVTLSELFSDITMKSNAVEYARELYGLLFQAFWMLILTTIQVVRNQQKLSAVD